MGKELGIRFPTRESTGTSGIGTGKANDGTTFDFYMGILDRICGPFDHRDRKTLSGKFHLDIFPQPHQHQAMAASEFLPVRVLFGSPGDAQQLRRGSYHRKIGETFPQMNSSSITSPMTNNRCSRARSRRCCILSTFI